MGRKEYLRVMPLRCLSLWIWWLVGAVSLATELPVETFFRNYQYNEALLSPDGDFLGVLAPDANRVGLAIIDLKNNRASWAFADRLADVNNFFWISTNRLAFRLSHDGYAEAGLMAVDRDGKRATRLIGAKGAVA